MTETNSLPNTDGKVEIKGNTLIYQGKNYVPESDLLAVKSGAEKEKENLTASHATALTEARRIGDEHYQNLLNSGAKISELEKQLAGLPKSEDLTNLKKQLEDATKNGEGLRNQLLTHRRQTIATSFGIDIKSLESKSLQDLDSLEEAAKLVKGGKGGAGYEMGGSGGKATAPSIRDIIDEAKSRK